MRLLVNDHSGHPFQIQLSKQLAKSGFDVLHTYSANFQTPKGNFKLSEEEKSKLSVIPIFYNATFNKYSLIRRRRQEHEFASKLIQEIEKFKPEIIICSNTPLFAQEKIQLYCISRKIKFIFWCQDIYSIAIEKILIGKLGFFGKIIGRYFKSLEKKQLKRSDFIVNITDDFNPLFEKWGIALSKIKVIPNWAPLNEIPLVDKNNDWSNKHNFSDQFCITYSGTLGLKHNPSLLVDLAVYFQKIPNVTILVISEGLGANYLKEEQRKKQLNNLVILPFQEFNDMPSMMGASNILLAILEPDAGVFSVPSKVLTYLCSGKPLVLSVPFNNLSAKIVMRYNCGITVKPNSSSDLIQAVKKIYESKELGLEMGKNGREYAEQNFDINTICNNFIKIINKIIIA